MLAFFENYMQIKRAVFPLCITCMIFQRQKIAKLLQIVKFMILQVGAEEINEPIKL